MQCLGTGICSCDKVIMDSTNLPNGFGQLCSKYSITPFTCGLSTRFEKHKSQCKKLLLTLSVLMELLSIRGLKLQTLHHSFVQEKCSLVIYDSKLFSFVSTINLNSPVSFSV